ncbi:TIGR04283 family arsenosugar biosynthesis glycosyltransferase [Nitrospira sp. Nam80]
MISVIIPAYNEERALPVTLHHLMQLPGEFEVLLVDGGSGDRTVAIASRMTGVRVLHARKGRATQMNVGAAVARGEWLLFLHADTLLPGEALVRVNRLEGEPAAEAGGFLHRFSGTDWRLRMISWLDNFRCMRSRIIYGDQAMFVRRSLFNRLGGFPEVPILEDVAFCEKLVQVTTPLLLSPPVITDARKFLKMGVWRSFVRVLLIILHVQFHVPFLPRAFFREVR